MCIRDSLEIVIGRADIRDSIKILPRHDALVSAKAFDTSSCRRILDIEADITQSLMGGIPTYMFEFGEIVHDMLFVGR